MWDPGGSTVLTQRWSTGRFVTAPSDTPANTAYDARLDQPANFLRALIGEGRTYGDSESAEGLGELRNEDRGLDGLLNWGWDGRTARIYTALGGQTRAQARLVATVALKVPETRPASLYLRFEDLTADLKKPIQTNTYAGTNSGATGDEGLATDIKGQAKPLCYGEVQNVTPVRVNGPGIRFQVHDGPIEDVTAVYDRGLPLVKVASKPGIGQYAVWNHKGIIVLGSEPAGQITCDVKGDKSGGTYVDKIGDLVERILRRHGGKGMGTPNRKTQVWDVSGTVHSFTAPADATSTLKFKLWGGGGANAGAIAAVGTEGLGALGGGGGYAERTFTAGTHYTAGSTVFEIRIGGGGVTPVLTGSSGGVGGWNGGAAGAAGPAATFRMGGGGGGGASDVRFAATSTVRQAMAGGGGGGTGGGGVTYLSGAGGGTTGQASAGTGTVAQGGTQAAGGTAGTGASAGTQFNGGAGGPGVAYNAGADSRGGGGGGGGYYGGGGGAGLDPPTSGSGGAGGSGWLNGGTGTLTQGNRDAPGNAGDADLPAAFARGGQNGSKGGGDGFVLAEWPQTSVAASTDWMDTASFTQLNTDLPGVAGIFIANGDGVAIGEVLDALLGGAGCFHGVKRDGKFFVGRLKAPAGTPVKTITRATLLADIERRTSADEEQSVPPWRIAANYARNFTVQTGSDLASTATEARKTFALNEWRTALGDDAAVQTKHLLSRPLVFGTPFKTESDAQSFANVERDLRKVRRDSVAIVLPLEEALDLELNDTVRLTVPEFGYGAGVLFRVMTIDENFREGRARIELWGGSP